MTTHKIARLLNVEHSVNSNNEISLELEGFNSAGKRVTVRLEGSEVYMISHLAEEAITAIKEVKRRVEHELATIRHTVGD